MRAGDAKDSALLNFAFPSPSLFVIARKASPVAPADIVTQARKVEKLPNSSPYYVRLEPHLRVPIVQELVREEPMAVPSLNLGNQVIFQFWKICVSSTTPEFSTPPTT